MGAAATASQNQPHIPVLLRPLLAGVAPVSGVWVDGTFGAGGYARGLLNAGAERVIGIDQDPLALEMAAAWAADYHGRLELVEGNFAALDQLASDAGGAGGVDGVVLDLGVSSMQLDLAERGFSFRQDGPLDMRMSQAGESAADIVNDADEGRLADILFHFGEERAARRIARAIVRVRAEGRIASTRQLAEIIENTLPRAKPGQSHPATRSFQAIRIAVNSEFEALVDGLAAAERALKPGGLLAVVTFHSLEDRVVKRFIQNRSDTGGGGSRHAPERAMRDAQFEPVTKRAVGPDEAELAENPRARSARLRIARRLDAPSGPVDRKKLALPSLPPQRRR